MPKIKLSTKTTGQSGQRMRWNLPAMTVTIPTELELRRIVAAHVRVRLREALQDTGTQWRGFAVWLEGEMRVDDRGVSWPGSEAAERIGVLGLDPRWLDEAIEIALKDAIT